MITIQPAETVLLVIDMQNGCCAVEGTLGISGVDISSNQAIVPRVKRLVETCRTAGIPDVWTQHLAYTQDHGRDGHRIPPHSLKRRRLLCEAHTWDAEIVDDLKPLLTGRTEIVKKHRWSACAGTRLFPLLRILGARLVVVCGTSTNACVDTSVRDLYQNDYDVVLVEDCIAGINEERWRTPALEAWDWYVGDVVTLEQLLHEGLAKV